MRICIYGAGAVGGYLGVGLAEGGAEVSLVARGAHLDAIRRDGLTLHINGETRVARLPATDDPADLGPQDFVIVALKAHQAWEVAEAMRPLLGPETAVVTAQNGIPWWYFHGFEGPYADLRLRSVDPDERQWRAIGPARAIGCTVYPAAEIAAPGIVRHLYGDRFGLGEPVGGVSDRLEALAAAFTAGGLQPRIHPRIRDDIWLRLLGNLSFGPLSALTGATLDALATDPGTRAVVRAMMREAESVGRRVGVHFRVDIDRRIAGAAAVGRHRPAMLQDLDRARPIELDALLTVVQEMGRIVGAETPTIDAVLALAQQRGRMAGVYPVFPEAARRDDAEAAGVD